MVDSTPPEALRNTQSLAAWRAYNAKAAAPLVIAAPLSSVFIGAMIPVETALIRHHHGLLAIGVSAGALGLSLAWMVVAFLKVRAYKRTHPFVPPPVTVWGQTKL